MNAYNLPKAVWDRYGVGSEIEIVRLENDSQPYHEEGVFASDGNFAFDQTLLVVECAMMIVPLPLVVAMFLFQAWRSQNQDKEMNLQFRRPN